MKHRICQKISGYDCWGKPEWDYNWIPTPDFMTDEQLYEFAMDIQRNNSDDAVELDGIPVRQWKMLTERRRRAEEAALREKSLSDKDAERQRQWDSLSEKSKRYVRDKWRAEPESREVLEDVYGSNVKE